LSAPVKLGRSADIDRFPNGGICVTRYVIKRILFAIPIFFLITMAVYILSCMAPGSVIDVLAGEGSMTKEAYAALVEQYNLDKPAIVRYLIWLGNVFQGDLGLSTSTSQPVVSMITARIAPTLILTCTAMLVSVVISIPLGVLAAYKPYSVWDNVSSVLTFVGASVPNFFFALVGIYFFAVKLQLLPAQGMYTTGATPTLPDLARHLVLPTIVLSVQLMGNYLKQTRGSMLEVLNEEYIKTARSKGLSELATVVVHALRNAWIPIVTTIGLNVPFLIGGAVVTEQVFGWPGLGSLMMTAINNRDYNLIMGITMLIAVVVLLVNILLDVLYAYLDPKIGRSMV
jgi:peptide/nickel transport system permease protein